MKKILYYCSAAALAVVMGSCNDAGFQPTDDSIYMGNAIGVEKVETSIVEGVKTVYFNIYTAKKAEKDITVTTKIDTDFLAEYNARYSTNYQLLPDDLWEIESFTAVIPAGENFTSVEAKVSELTPELNKSGFTYVLPLGIDKADGGPAILQTSKSYMYALAPVPYADVVEFNTNYFGNLVLSENMDATTMTIEALIMYASSTVSVVRKGNPFVMYNLADGAGAGASAGLYSRFGDAGRPGNHINGNIRGRYDFPDDALLTPWRWNHVVFQIDVSSGFYRWYLDGEVTVKDKGWAAANNYGFIVDKDRILLGREGAGISGVPLRYAHVKIWNTLRTQSEIRNNMYAVDINSPGLIGYWKLDEGEGTAFKDATGRNPDGYVTNGNGPVDNVVWVPNQRVELGFPAE